MLALDGDAPVPVAETRVKATVRYPRLPLEWKSVNELKKLTRILDRGGVLNPAQQRAFDAVNRTLAERGPDGPIPNDDTDTSK